MPRSSQIAAEPRTRSRVSKKALDHVVTQKVADASSEVRKAVAVDPKIKTSNLNRLRRIEGQIRGLQKMIEEDRYCADILVQISSVQEALRGVGRALMRNHLQHCATDAFTKGTHEEAREMYDELLELIYRYLR